MATAWRDVVGDAVDPDTVWSMTWTMGHFFIDNLWFYNFPYAFGALFALGLLAVREAEPDGFLDRFDTLLADSGMREANELAADFGIDLRDPAFWRASLDGFRDDVERYEALSPVDRGSERGWFWLGDHRDVGDDRAANGYRKCLAPRARWTKYEPGSQLRPSLFGRIPEGARGTPLFWCPQCANCLGSCSHAEACYGAFLVR